MKTFIVGAGAHGRMTVDILRAAGTTDLAFIDDQTALHGTSILDVPVAGGIDHLIANAKSGQALLAIGKPPARAALAKRLASAGVAFANAIHPSAIVMATASIGHGNILGPQVIVETGSVLGDHCLLNAGVLVAHDGIVGSCVNLSPGVLLGGRVKVGDGVFVGIGACVLPRLSIGEGSIVGATALVTADVEERVMTIGSPAKALWVVKDDFDWSKLL